MLQPEDIISALPSDALLNIKISVSARRKDPGGAVETLSPEAKQVLSCIGESEMPHEQIVEKLGWPVAGTSAAIFELESAGVIVLREGKYERA